MDEIVDPLNRTAELEKELAQKKKVREQMRQQMLTEQNNVMQFFGGLQFNHFVFLTLLGALTAISSYTIDLVVTKVNGCKFTEESTHT